MKCPMCLGKGYATDEDIKEYPHRCQNCNGKGFYSVDWQKVRCEVCNGSGKKPMTKQEYLQTCNTEQLAEFIIKAMLFYDNAGITVLDAIKNAVEDNEKLSKSFIENVVAWLKQPHSEVGK